MEIDSRTATDLTLKSPAWLTDSVPMPGIFSSASQNVEDASCEFA